MFALLLSSQPRPPNAIAAPEPGTGGRYLCKTNHAFPSANHSSICMCFNHTLNKACTCAVGDSYADLQVIPSRPAKNPTPLKGYVIMITSIPSLSPAYSREDYIIWLGFPTRTKYGEAARHGPSYASTTLKYIGRGYCCNVRRVLECRGCTDRWPERFVEARIATSNVLVWFNVVANVYTTYNTTTMLPQGGPILHVR